MWKFKEFLHKIPYPYLHLHACKISDSYTKRCVSFQMWKFKSFSACSAFLNGLLLSSVSNKGPIHIKSNCNTLYSKVSNKGPIHIKSNCNTLYSKVSNKGPIHIKSNCNTLYSKVPRRNTAIQRNLIWQSRCCIKELGQMYFRAYPSDRD